MVYNLSTQLEDLTAIDPNIIKSILSKISCIISEDVREDILENKTLTEITFEFGTLYIFHDDAQVKYKFIPNEVLSKDIIESVKSKGEHAVLQDKITKAAISMVSNSYKEYF